MKTAHLKGLALSLMAGIAITACDDNATTPSTPAASDTTPTENVASNNTPTPEAASPASPENAAIAQAPPTSQSLNTWSNDSGIPEAGLEVLQTLDMTVAVPTYMPNYMNFQQLELELSDRGSVTYRITYEGLNVESSELLCVTIEGTNTQVRTVLPMDNRYYSGTNETYGSFTMLEGLYGEATLPVLVGNWLAKPGVDEFYRFAGTDFYNDYTACNDVAVDEAIAITESLRPLP